MHVVMSLQSDDLSNPNCAACRVSLAYVQPATACVSPAAPAPNPRGTRARWREHALAHRTPDLGTRHSACSRRARCCATDTLLLPSTNPLDIVPRVAQAATDRCVSDCFRSASLAHLPQDCHDGPVNAMFGVAQTTMPPPAQLPPSAVRRCRLAGSSAASVKFGAGRPQRRVRDQVRRRRCGGTKRDPPQMPAPMHRPRTNFSLLHDGTRHPWLVAASGLTNKEIAADLGLEANMVGRWRNATLRDAYLGASSNESRRQRHSTVSRVGEAAVCDGERIQPK